MMFETIRSAKMARKISVERAYISGVTRRFVIEKIRIGRVCEVVPLTKDEYVDIIVRQLEVIPPEVVIQRLTGDGARDALIAPLWSLKKFEVLNAIDKLMAERNTYQGEKYEIQNTDI